MTKKFILIISLLVFALITIVSAEGLSVRDRIGQTATDPDDRMIYQQQVNAGAILNIKEAPFNAKGDGITDDTASIQAAIDAATDPSNAIAKILLIPDGWYVISSTLLIKNTRYFRMVGVGGGTQFLWKGDSVSPALKIVNASYSEFSNFGITPPYQGFLKTGILIEDTKDGKRQDKKFVSTHNIFRNIGIGSNWDDLDVGIQIQSHKQNDYHMFLNCSIVNYAGTGIIINAEKVKKSTNLFFYNVLLQAPADGPQRGVVSTGGAYYWINGGVSNLIKGDSYAFDITDPTGPITINLTNEEGTSGFVKAVASHGMVLDLTIENNRFTGIPNMNEIPFIDISGKGDVRINKNHFRTDERLVWFNRTGAKKHDLYEYQYNRIVSHNPDQPITIESLFSGVAPSQLHENHYAIYSPVLSTAGQYASVHAYDPPGSSDNTVLEPYFDRMRKLSDSQFLFSRYAYNSAGIKDIRKPPYNAKGDGITDDTRAFQQALDEMDSNRYDTGMLLIPAGDYLISNTLSVDLASLGLRIIGEGSDRSRLIWTGNGIPDNQTVVMDLAGVSYGEVRGIGLVFTPGSSADIGIRVRTGSRGLATRNSFFDIAVDGEAGDLGTAFKVGDGLDANNDFHVFQDVIVSGYRNNGFEVVNTQIFNLVFLDCWANGFVPESGNTSQVGLLLGAGTLSWFGGGGRNHAVADMNLATHGNAPVIVSRANFENSASLLKNGGPNQILIFMNLDSVSYTSSGSNNRFIELFSPGIHLIQNCSFKINEGQTLFSFGDYSRYVPDEDKDAIRSLEGFDLIGNEIISTTAEWGTLYSAREPTYARDNEILFP